MLWQGSGTFCWQNAQTMASASIRAYAGGNVEADSRFRREYLCEGGPAQQGARPRSRSLAAIASRRGPRLSRRSISIRLRPGIAVRLAALPASAAALHDHSEARTLG